MSLLRAMLQFFKTWFLPTPAHDDPRFAKELSEEANGARVSGTTEPAQDFHDGMNGDPDDDDDYDDEEDDGGELDLPDPDYPKKVAMYPVAEPEGAEERASRLPGGSNPFSEE